MTTPPIAVIIPTHNRAHLLERAITSVLNQTWPSFELLIVDDGSTDATPLIESIIHPDPRLRYVRYPENRGVSCARNTGVDQTAAPWIAFLDSDDEWLPAKLEKQLTFAANHPEFKIIQTKELWIRNGVRVNPPKTHEKTHGDLFAASLRRCMITPSSVMLTRDLYCAAGGFNESLTACEDYDLWLKITRAHPVGLVDEDLLRRYGGHNDQLSSTVKILDRFRIQSILDLLRADCLTSEQETLALRRLYELATIVAKGYKKHGNEKEYEYYSNLSIPKSARTL